MPAADSVMTPIYDEIGHHCGFLKIVRDVSDRHLIEEELFHAANTDALTGLSNRASFHEHLHEWAVAGARAAKTIVLHLIDLDHFKEINDSFGHQSGDLLLSKIGLALKEVARETDFVARLGGDEFAILQAGATSVLDGGHLAEKILERLDRSSN
jgi:diguanylate cyclase (GGDEF)-like protein